MDIYQLLDSLDVQYQRYDHAPVMTCDEAEAAVPEREAAHTKNLFFRDKKGRRHVLLVTSCTKPVNIKAFADKIGADNLSFASPDRMKKYLGVTPGAVTILGLAVDTDHAVELFVDSDVWKATAMRAHPLTNTATLILPRTAIERFLAHTGHEPRIITLE